MCHYANHLDRSVQYGSGKDHLRSIFLSCVYHSGYLKINLDLNQNYRIWIGFKCLASKWGYVVALPLCDFQTFSHSMGFGGFPFPYFVLCQSCKSIDQLTSLSHTV